MPIRPRKRVLGSAVIGAALELGEANPLKKAADAIRDSGGSGGGSPAPSSPGKRLNRVPFDKKYPHTGKGLARVQTAPTPIRKAGFGGVTRKDSPSKRKMRRRGPRNQ
jgi:hypothetical protein